MNIIRTSGLRLAFHAATTSGPLSHNT